MTKRRKHKNIVGFSKKMSDLQTMERLIEASDRRNRIRYGPVRDWGVRKSKVIFGTRQFRLSELTDWEVIRRVPGVEEACARAKARAEEMEADGSLQQRILEVEALEEVVHLKFSGNELEYKMMMDELFQALSQGVATEEVVDETIV